ncbi:MAG: YfhO family protein, partial [Chloroflexota bacterium]
AQFAGAQFNCAPTSAVEITRYQPERVEIKATTDRAGYLVLTDSWYPGWRAFVDGQPAPIYRADVIFRAVPLEPGTHTIVFEYRPDSFLIGAIISAASFIILVVYVGMNLGRAK